MKKLVLLLFVFNTLIFNITGQSVFNSKRISNTDIITLQNIFAPKASPTFTGTVNGITPSMVGLGNVTNVTDSLKSVSNPTKTALGLKSDLTYTNQKLHTVTSIVNLQAYTLTDLCQFDGSIWERKSGNVASNGGIYAGTIINVSSSNYWQRKVFDFIKPQYFGAKGDGVTDDTQSIQNCLNASLFVYFGNIASNYKVSGNLILRSGHVLDGGNCTITQTAYRTILFQCGSLNNFTFTNFNFVGYGTGDYDESGDANPLAIAISIINGSNIKVSKCTFTNFSYTSLQAVGTNDVDFNNNVVVGLGSPFLIPSSMTRARCYGVLIQGTNIKITNNKISQSSQGILLGVASNHVIISENIIYDIINQHGMYLQEGITNLIVNKNTVRNTGNIGIKLQQNDASGKDSYNIIISDNITENTGQEGILVINSTGSASIYSLRNVNVTNNTVKNSGQSGISIRNVKKGIVSTNIISLTSQDGIAFNSCDNIITSFNNISDSGTNGIRFGVSCNYMNTHNNTINNIGEQNISTETYGIFVNSGSYHNIFKNDIYDFNSKMPYGIFFANGDQTTARIENNQITNSTSYGIRLVTPTQTIKKLINNVFINCVAGVTNGSEIWDGINTFASIISPTVTGSTLTNSGLILQSTTGVGTTGSNIDFLTGSNGSINALRILPSGNIGLGALTPSSKFEVTYNGADTQPIAIFRNTNTSGFSGLQLDRSATVRYALSQYSTNGTIDWQVGTAYGNGAGNSAFSIGQTINLSDAKFTILPSGSIGINNPAPNISSILDITSTTSGLLIPRMTTIQRNAITGVNGLQVYDIELNKIFIHNGTNWGTVGALTGSFSQTGSATTTFTVIIGTTMPNTTYTPIITPTSMLAASSYYISNQTTTTFDVSYLTAVTGSITFKFAVFR